jgi:hypothetical protein
MLLSGRAAADRVFEILDAEESRMRARGKELAKTIPGMCV